MNNTFASLNCLPPELGDLILGLAYDRTMKQVDQRIVEARDSWFLPVPTMWLRYYHNGNYELNWDVVFDFSLSHAINLDAVAETASYLHYSCMRHNQQLSSLIVHKYCKGEVVRALRGWRTCAHTNFLQELVNLVWFSLCGKYSLIKSVYCNYSLEMIQKYTHIDPMKFSLFVRKRNIELFTFPVLPVAERRSVLDWMMIT